MLKLNRQGRVPSAILLLSQRLEKVFLFFLAVLLPTQLAFHFWPDYSLVSGIRIDYLAPTIFLTDVVIFGLFAASIFSRKITVSKKTAASLLIIFLFAALNTAFSTNIYVSMFRWLKVFEFSFVVLYFTKVTKLSLQKFAEFLLVGLIFSFVLGVLQILNGSTIGGIFRLLGERSFNIETPGIAVFSLFGQKTLRAYSTFPHPNALGGYGVVVSVAVYLLARSKAIKAFGLIVGTLISLISFSRATIASEILVLLFIFKGSHKHFDLFVKKAILGLTILSMLFLPSSKLFLEQGFATTESVAKRIELTNFAGRVFSDKPYFGVGLGNFVAETSKFQGTGVKLLQPVHNIFLLVLTETGIIGLGLFLILLVRIASSKLNGKVLLLAPILVTSLVDHYWLTLQQPALLFAIVIGILL